MTNREKAKHIDAFKYWCESNEENGVITLPKFLCEHIVEILDDTNARPHGVWKNGVCTNCGAECFEDYYMRDIKTEFCHRCGADMRTQNDRSWDTSERGVSGSVENSISQKEGEAE